MQDYLKIAKQIDDISDVCESSGRYMEAHTLDRVANSLEAYVQNSPSGGAFPPEILKAFQDAGVPPTLENALEIMDKYLPEAVKSGIGSDGNPIEMGQGDLGVREAAMGPAAKFVTLAAMLAATFVSSAEARNKPVVFNTAQGMQSYSVQQLKSMKKSNPDKFVDVIKSSKGYEKDVKDMFQDVKKKGGSITVKFNTGPKTYGIQDLMDLYKSDAKSFAVVKDVYDQAEKEHLTTRTQDSITVDDQGNMPKPGYSDKSTENIEELSDDFGNEARLITFTDGTQKLEGDIYHGGVSFRDKLISSGKIPHDPNEKSLGKQ